MNTIITIIFFLISLSIIKIIIIIIIKKTLILLQQFATGFGMYTFFSLACFLCNFLSLISTKSFSEIDDIIYVYTNLYINEHEDMELDYDETASLIKKEFYLKSLAHIILLVIMVNIIYVNGINYNNNFINCFW